MFKESPIIRRKSRQIMVGNVPVGGDAPITVQSMTNTLTTDVAATVAITAPTIIFFLIVNSLNLLQ